MVKFATSTIHVMVNVQILLKNQMFFNKVMVNFHDHVHFKHHHDPLQVLGQRISNVEDVSCRGPTGQHHQPQRGPNKSVMVEYSIHNISLMNINLIILISFE